MHPSTDQSSQPDGDPAREAIMSILDMYRREFRGPPPQAITEAVKDASFVVAGIDKNSGAWNPVRREYGADEIQASLRALCDAFSGPIMDRAPPHITEIIDAAKEYVSELESGPSPSP